jgi:hypothetical protein
MDASCRWGHLAWAASSPGPKCPWCVVLLAPVDLQRRNTTARAFGTEGQRLQIGCSYTTKLT